MTMHRSFMKTVAVTTLGALLAACGGDSSSSSTQPVVRLNLASQAGTAAAASRTASVADPYTITDGSGNTLTFESVQMVMREIELKRADRDVVCGSDDSNSDGSDDSSSDCEEIGFGPLVFDVPLGAGPARAISVPVSAGSYDKLEFEIHKPSSSDDAAFVAANPNFNGVSIRVTGTYNGMPFTYTSDLDVEQEQDLAPPLAVVEGQAAELTLFVSLDGWFRSETGVLLDPATANDGQPNEGEVKSNIEQSLNAFEDDDRDGQDD
jgi:hypothetical protein